MKKLDLTPYEKDKILKSLMTKHYLSYHTNEGQPDTVMIEVFFYPLNTLLNTNESIVLDDEDLKSIGDLFYAAKLALIKGEWSDSTHYYLHPLNEITDLFNQAYDLQRCLKKEGLDKSLPKEEFSEFMDFFEQLTHFVKTIEIDHYFIQKDLDGYTRLSEKQYAFAKRFGYDFPV